MFTVPTTTTEALSLSNHEIISELISKTQGITQIYNAIYKPDLTNFDKAVRIQNRIDKLKCLVENIEQLMDSSYPNSVTTPIEEAIGTVINTYFSMEFCSATPNQEQVEALKYLKIIAEKTQNISPKVRENLIISIKNLDQLIDSETKQTIVYFRSQY